MRSNPRRRRGRAHGACHTILKGVHVAVDLIHGPHVMVVPDRGREVRFIDFIEGARQLIGAYLKQRRSGYVTTPSICAGRSREGAQNWQECEEIIPCRRLPHSDRAKSGREDGINAANDAPTRGSTRRAAWMAQSLEEVSLRSGRQRRASSRPVHDEACHSAEHLIRRHA
jgi:hypothetical protein